MEHFIQLNLHSDGERAKAPSFFKPERKDPEAPVIGRRLNRILNRAAHKAATEFGRSRSGIFFSK